MKKAKKKRDLFTELMAAVADMHANREGRRTFRHYRVEVKPLRLAEFRAVALRMRRGLKGRTHTDSAELQAEDRCR
jgi:hypothetical protein